jgi:hypothetical protein
MYLEKKIKRHSQNTSRLYVSTVGILFNYNIYREYIFKSAVKTF